MRLSVCLSVCLFVCPCVSTYPGEHLLQDRWTNLDQTWGGSGGAAPNLPPGFDPETPRSEEGRVTLSADSVDSGP